MTEAGFQQPGHYRGIGGRGPAQADPRVADAAGGFGE